MLFSPDEQAEVSEHPLISWVDVPAMSPEVAAEAHGVESGLLDVRDGVSDLAPVGHRPV